MGSVEHLTGTAPSRLHELLAAAQRRLGASARLDTEVLLAHVLQQPRSVLFAERERPATAAQAAQYRVLIERRAAGEPVAYLTGEREFWSLSLEVSPAVLVPRPETELVVERVLALLGQPSAATAPSRVLELGTGSGAIALALATSRPPWRITAVERSAAALQVARAQRAAPRPRGRGIPRRRLVRTAGATPLRTRLQQPALHRGRRCGAGRSAIRADRSIGGRRHRVRSLAAAGRAVRPRTWNAAAGWCSSTAPARRARWRRRLWQAVMFTYAATAIWPDSIASPKLSGRVDP